MEIISSSPAETRALGRRLAGKLTPGTVIAFTGDLGAGKTALISGLAEGLGVTDRVTSPTFTIVNEYEGGRLPLFHFDLYRLGGRLGLGDCPGLGGRPGLGGEEELYDIGWDDYLVRGGVCAVEWSENAPEAMEDASRLIRVDLKRGAGDEERVITLEGVEL